MKFRGLIEVSAPSFALIAGLAYLVASAAGLLSGTLPVSVLHHAAHFALGLWGLAAWTGATSAIAFSRSLAGIGAAFALIGLTGLDVQWNRVPLEAHDLWMHIVTGALGAYFGFRTAALPELHAERRLAERRRSTRPVAFDQRYEETDRRTFA